MTGPRRGRGRARASLPRRGTVRVVDPQKGRVICDRVVIAGTFLTRLVGLLGRRALAPGHGLWLVPSAGVHTLGMRFAIDVVLLDEEQRVLAVHCEVAAGRVVGLRSRSSSALELPAGTLRPGDLQPGDLLAFQAAASETEVPLHG